MCRTPPLAGGVYFFTLFSNFIAFSTTWKYDLDRGKK